MGRSSEGQPFNNFTRRVEDAVEHLSGDQTLPLDFEQRTSVNQNAETKEIHNYLTIRALDLHKVLLVLLVDQLVEGHCQVAVREDLRLASKGHGDLVVQRGM
jgi:hypothetical protein